MELEIKRMEMQVSCFLIVLMSIYKSDLSKQIWS